LTADENWESVPRSAAAIASVASRPSLRISCNAAPVTPFDCRVLSAATNLCARSLRAFSAAIAPCGEFAGVEPAAHTDPEPAQIESPIRFCWMVLESESRRDTASSRVCLALSNAFWVASSCFFRPLRPVAAEFAATAAPNGLVAPVAAAVSFATLWSAWA
jgi:hypothetical protein